MLGKRFGLGLGRSLFVFCITAVAVLAAVNSVFGSPQPLKKALVDGNVYDTAAAGLVDQIAKEGQKEQGPDHEDVNLAQPAVQNAAKQVVTGTRLQGYAEQAIDGTYHWLDGTTKTPDFSLDLSSLKQDLGASVGGAAVQQIQSLPVCTPAQLKQIDTTHIDPFNLPCQPAGINLEAQRQQVIADIASSDAVQNKPITAADLRTEGETQDPFQKLKLVPVLFQWSKVGPWIFGTLAIVLAAALIFLRHDRRRGIKAVAVSLLITGVVLLGVIALTTFAFSKIPLPGNSDNPQMQEAVLAVIRTLGRSLNRVLLFFAAAYAALGIAGLAYLHFTKPPTAKHQEDQGPQKETIDEPNPHRPMKTAHDKPTSGESKS